MGGGGNGKLNDLRNQDSCGHTNSSLLNMVPELDDIQSIGQDEV